MITLRRCLFLHLPSVTPHPKQPPRLADVNATTTPSANGQLHLLRASSSSARQSKILRKLVTGKEKAKRRWYQDGPSTPKLVTAASLSNPARQGKNAPRRVHVLNKLFMKHITDLMSTGETADVLVGRGLQVSHVKVSADFNYVNVFWSTTTTTATAKSDDSTTDELEAVLRLVAGQLRHELSQLRLMGEVPRIQFVRDRHMYSEAHIDALLARADFGPDYEPAGWAQLRQDLAQGERTARGALPAMRHDVLGLNQVDIMGKIRQTMVKSRQAWERYAEAGVIAGDSAGNAVANRVDVVDPAEGTTMTLAERRTELTEQTRQRDEEFAKFLEQRRYTRRLRVVQKNPDFRESYHRAGYDDDETERFFDPSSGGDYIEEDGPIH